MRLKPPPREDVPQPLPRPEPYQGPAPPLASFRAHDVSGVVVYCEVVGCQPGQRIAFDDLPVDLDRMTVAGLAASGRLICRRCGGRRVNILPDWPVDRGRPQWVRDEVRATGALPGRRSPEPTQE